MVIWLVTTWAAALETTVTWSDFAWDSNSGQDEFGDETDPDSKLLGESTFDRNQYESILCKLLDGYRNQLL